MIPFFQIKFSGLAILTNFEQEKRRKSSFKLSKNEIITQYYYYFY